MKTYILKTLGCKANLFDGQLIEQELKRRGWRRWAPSGGPADLCIVNSCTVTDEADRQSRKLAAKFGRTHPGTVVVVTGCAAEIDPERLAYSEGITYLIGNRDKPKLVDLIFEKLASTGSTGNSGARTLGTGPKGYSEMISRHPLDRQWPDVLDAPGLPGLDQTSSRTRAFLKIQEGCNSFCTYCVIPYARGPARSLELERVVAHARSLEQEGFREVVITGTHIGDYGSDFSDSEKAATFEGLLAEVLAATHHLRIRVGSLDPTEITPGILELMRSESRFCPHFHVSLQSAHPAVLRLMKRRYGTAEIRAALEKIAGIPAPVGGPFIGMDVITGFPGETGEYFEHSIEFLSALPWTRLHVFPYSERSGTPATRLPGIVPQALRLERARRLGELSLKRIEAHYRDVMRRSRDANSAIQDVLVESRCLAPKGCNQAENGWASGYSSHYLKCFFPLSPGTARNGLIQFLPEEVRVEAASGEAYFVGKVV